MSQLEDDWLQAIVKKSALEPSAVDAVLASHRIQPSPVLAQPRRLLLKAIEFSGVKEQVENAGPFSFSWTALESGLWGVLTKDNLRGKSTIFEVVRWMLRGRPGSNLQDDVRGWIHSARVEFLLDAEHYEISASTTGQPVGTLNLMRPPSEAGGDATSNVRGSFSTDAQFEAVMADFFMRAFSMDTMSTWRTSTEGDDDGQSITHGWPAFSGAMFIGTDYSVLLGDLPVTSGLTSRLLQMYLGVPWVSTHAAARVARQTVDQAAQSAQRKKRQSTSATEERVATIRTKLEAARANLASIPSDEDVRNAIDADLAQISILRRQEGIGYARLENAAAAIRDALAIHQEDRRDLQALSDSMAAVSLFRRLDPKCCPRCDHEISIAKKKAEATDRSCSVCGESVLASEDGEAIKVAILARVEASATALARANEQRDQTAAELAELSKKINLLQSRIEAASLNLSSAVQRQDAVQAVAVLEARLDEASSVTAEPLEDRSDELKILSAVVAESEKRVKAVLDGLLVKVSERLVDYAKAFGMENLSAASLKGNATLSLVKGGADTSYSKLTAGEKLRLKVATVLSMIEIAEAEAIGRHPGLLMIDSPAAQEVSPRDVEQLVAGLHAVSAKLPHLQVFVAGLASQAITDHIPQARRREAASGGYLW